MYIYWRLNWCVIFSNHSSRDTSSDQMSNDQSKDACKPEVREIDLKELADELSKLYPKEEQVMEGITTYENYVEIGRDFIEQQYQQWQLNKVKLQILLMAKNFYEKVNQQKALAAQQEKEETPISMTVEREAVEQQSSDSAMSRAPSPEPGRISRLLSSWPRSSDPIPEEDIEFPCGTAALSL